MKIFLDNVDEQSNSGPNSFAKKFKEQAKKSGHHFVKPPEIADVQLSFIMAQNLVAPLVQRLDGIYFNSTQNWRAMNAPIRATYEISKAVIFQSHFNKLLSEKYFGEHKNGHVIHNGTSFDEIAKINPLEHPKFSKFSDVWSCASSWRPHKRLQENIKYFYEHAPKDACLVVAGNVDKPVNVYRDGRVTFAGELSWHNLISLYKRSSHFIHLAFLDHCPNVIVDARAAGCHIVCSSTGGTQEIAGENSTIILEEEWNFMPLELYNPPPIDFSKKKAGAWKTDIDIVNVCDSYVKVLETAK